MKTQDLKLADEIFIFQLGEQFTVTDDTYRITRIEREGKTTTIRITETK